MQYVPTRAAIEVAYREAMHYIPRDHPIRSLNSEKSLEGLLDCFSYDLRAFPRDMKDANFVKK